MAAQRGGRTEQISRDYLALRRMLWRHFSAEEPWVLEWICIPSDTCGRTNSIWIRYVWRGNFWIRKEKVADSKISGYVWTGPKPHPTPLNCRIKLSPRRQKIGTIHSRLTRKWALSWEEPATLVWILLTFSSAPSSTGKSICSCVLYRFTREWNSVLHKYLTTNKKYCTL